MSNDVNAQPNALLLRVDTSVTDFAHLYLIPVIMGEDGQFRRAMGHWQDRPSYHWEDLRITAQINREDNPPEPYGWEVCYYRPYRVSPSRAKRMSATLQRLTRRLEKLKEEWGKPETYGRYCLRVARIIGADTLILEDKPHNVSNGWGKFQTIDMGPEAARAIDRAARNTAQPPAWAETETA